MLSRIKRFAAMCLAVLLMTMGSAAVYSAPAYAAPAVKQVTLNKKSLKLDMKNRKTYTLKASVSPKKAKQSVKWSTSNKAVATVNSKGVVTLKKAGSATITATSTANSKKKAQTKITVTDTRAPKKVSATKKNIKLAVGETDQLAVKVSPSSANNGVKYSTSKTSVATVNSKGVVTAKKSGTAKITVRSAYNSSVKDTVSVTVVKASTPKSISITPSVNSLTIKKTLQLKAKVAPSTASQKVTWKSSNTSVAKVNSNGLVTAKKAGTVTITATSQTKLSIKKSFKLTVVDAKKPTSVVVEGSNKLTLDIGETNQLSASVLPTTASQSVKYKSSATGVATVNSKGLITAKKAGKAVITVYASGNSSVKKTVTVTIKKLAAPSSISLSPNTNTLAIKKTLQLKASVSPSTASQQLTWKSSNTSVATVSSSGLVTAKKVGKVTVTVSSKRKSSIKKTLTINVVDPAVPTSISLSVKEVMLGQKDTLTVKTSISPSTANKTVNWSSSNVSVASVSSSGKITANKAGTATIKATTAKGGQVATVSVTVLDTTRSTTVPARTTSVSGIKGNLAKIEAIRRSARSQVDSEVLQGNISASEANTRKTIIDRAFEMQEFPWMVEKKQDYWNLSLNHKAFLPGKVYYGLPYIQHGNNYNYANRQYNVAKAVAEKRYTNTGKGYYMMNQDRYLNGKYVGNDCSSFVSQAQFKGNYNNTTAIAKSSLYKNISRTDMRPGDLLVRSGNHTVLFLYYTNAAKTQMMIIEQGGNGNTVICSVMSVAKYSNYTPRRQKTFR